MAHQKQVAWIRVTKIYCQKYVNFTFGQDADGHEIASMTGNMKKKYVKIFLTKITVLWG